MTEDGIQGIKITAQPEADWFLTSLVDFVNKHGNELPVTLAVKGVLISGLLTCYEKYFEAVGLDTDRIFGTASFPKSKANGGTAEADLPTYLHVMDARFYSGGQALEMPEGMWWRGRITEVSGFSFGRIKR